MVGGMTPPPPKKSQSLFYPPPTFFFKLTLYILVTEDTDVQLP